MTTRHTLRLITVAALAGTTLSGCAVLGGAADTVWSGTKSVANFVSYPVRAPIQAMLRDAPEEDIQFASEETDADTDAEVVEMAEAATDAAASDDWVSVETYVAEADIAATAPVTTSTTTSTSTTTTLRTVSTGSSRYSFGSQSVRVLPSEDGGSLVRMDGAASLADWRACEASAGSYWLFDGAVDAPGRLNPAFERCMGQQDYQLQTQVETTVIPASSPITSSASTLP